MATGWHGNRFHQPGTAFFFVCLFFDYFILKCQFSVRLLGDYLQHLDAESLVVGVWRGLVFTFYQTEVV